jgi:hypothetical protein
MGMAQAGGGTSIYRNVGPLPLETCPEYLSGAAVFDDKFLISFRDKKTGTGSVTVMQVNSSRKAVPLASSSNIHDLYHIVTLNQGTGLFVSISQQTTAVSPSDAVVIAGRSDSSAKVKYSIAYGAPTAYGTDGDFSFDPSLASLSNTTFAILYYNGNYSYTCFGRCNNIDWK